MLSIFSTDVLLYDYFIDLYNSFDIFPHFLGAKAHDMISIPVSFKIVNSAKGGYKLFEISVF